MINWLKSNWKTTLVGVVVAGFICWGIFGCNSEAVEEVPAVEEAPVEVSPEVTPEPVVE